MPKLLRRIITLTVLLAVVLFIIVGVVAWFIHKNDPPGAQEAPWAIQTSSRVYYARQVSMLPDKNPQIKDYWYSDGGVYHYVDGILAFPKNLYGPVKIIRRVSK